jgi:acyl carrier protein
VLHQFFGEINVTASTTQTVQSIIASVFDIAESDIVDTMSMQTYDLWDSLMQMRLVMSIEDSYGIMLTVDEITKMQSVGAIKDVLQERGLQ